MKKVHLVLTILAFFVAGAGVFATTQTVVEAITDPQISQTPCNVLVPENCLISGPNPCTFTGEISGKEYISERVRNQADDCVVLFRN